MRPYKRFIMFCAAAALLDRRHGGHQRGPGPRPRRGRWSAAAYYRPYYYRPYYYSPFFDPWYGYQYPYPYPPPYPYAYHAYEPDASVRLDVKPKQAEVYVDGYYAGIVDDFDGTFQRLHVPPGEHEIELWLDGYHTVRQKVHLHAGQHVPHQVPDGAARRRPGARAEAAADRAAAGRRQPAAAHAAARAAADGPRADDAADAAAARLSARSAEPARP